MNEIQFKELLKHAFLGKTATVLAAVDLDKTLVNRTNDDGHSIFFNACRGGHLELAQNLLDRDFNINQQDTDGHDALMEATMNGSKPVVKFLLSHGANIIARNHERRTALGIAAEFCNLDICKLLISRKADIMAIDMFDKNVLDTYGFLCCLESAQKEHCCAILRNAFEQGPHPDACWNRRWPFICVMVGCGFQPLKARQEQLLLENPPLPHDVSIPPIEINTVEKYRAYLHGCIFAHPGLWRIIASYL